MKFFLTPTIPNHKVLRYDQESSQNLKKNQSNKISYLQKFLVGSAVTVATRVCDLEEDESGKIQVDQVKHYTSLYVASPRKIKLSQHTMFKLSNKQH